MANSGPLKADGLQAAAAVGRRSGGGLGAAISRKAYAGFMAAETVQAVQ